MEIGNKGTSESAQRQQRIPIGDDSKKDEMQRQEQSEMRGSVRCAVHDETVSSFSRDDASLRSE